MTAGLTLKVIWQIRPKAGKYIFQEYLEPMHEFEQNIVVPFIESAVATQGNKFNAGFLYANREVVQDSIRESVISTLSTHYIDVEKDNILVVGEIDIPETLEKTIEAKVRSDEDRLRLENEIAQVEVDTRKKIAEAKRDSAAIVIDALAKAKANNILNQSLTPLLIKQQEINKWNGAYPQYMGNGTMGLFINK